MDTIEYDLTRLDACHALEQQKRTELALAQDLKADEIRAATEAGVSQAEIARRFGVKRQAINDYLRRRSGS